jgi:hypothetical protein
MLNLDDFAGMGIMGIIITVPFVLLGAIPGSVLLCMVIAVGVALALGGGKE